MNTFDYFVFVGTYTKPMWLETHETSEGIYTLEYNSSTGELKQKSSIKNHINPSFLAIHPNKKFLYSVGENEGGTVSAFSINRQNGQLTFINSESTKSIGPCHLSVDSTGKFLFVANYSGGASTMLPINEDGSLKPASSFIQHTGSSINPERQEGPHAHSINIDPNNNFALVPDLGLDKILIFKINFEKGELETNSFPYGTVEPGSGPRHLDFHPTGKFVYVLNEISATITAFSYDQNTAEMKEIETVSTLPKNFSTQSCADIHISKDGKFVYASNRGHDSIVIFKINQNNGKMEYVAHESTIGNIPRNFGIDPNGNFIIAANQDSSDIYSFKVDKELGLLSPTGFSINIPYPVCIKFLKK